MGEATSDVGRWELEKTNSVMKVCSLRLGFSVQCAKEKSKKAP
jgi:hypothetical protein